MKQTLQLPVIGIILFLIIGCSPRITTRLTKVYPPIISSENVTVYKIGDTIPEQTDPIGYITVDDKNGVCNKDKNVLQIACEETARNGGDGLLITRTEQTTEGNNLRKMEGIMLRLHLEKENLTPPLLISEYRRMQKIAEEEWMRRYGAPSNTFSVSIGPGIIYSKIYSATKTYRHKTGLDWKLEYNRVSRKGFGFGLLYSGFYTQFPDEHFTVGNRTKEAYMLLTYIAPAFVGRFKINDWILKFGIGLGYAGYNDGGLEILSGIGFHTDFGFECKLSKYIGLGIGMSAIDFIMPDQEWVNYDKDERSGITRWNIQAAIHYYF